MDPYPAYFFSCSSAKKRVTAVVENNEKHASNSLCEGIMPYRAESSSESTLSHEEAQSGLLVSWFTQCYDYIVMQSDYQKKKNIGYIHP